LDVPAEKHQATVATYYKVHKFESTIFPDKKLTSSVEITTNALGCKAEGHGFMSQPRGYL